MDNLSNYIKQWVTYDDYIKETNKKLKMIKEKRDSIEKDITNIMKQNKLTKTKFNIGNNNITYHENNVSCALSYKFIYDSLNKHLNQSDVDKICDLIKNERENTKKVTYSIKRNVNKV